MQKIHESQLESFKTNPIWVELKAYIERDIEGIHDEITLAPKESVFDSEGNIIRKGLEMLQGAKVAYMAILEQPDLIFQDSLIEQSNGKEE